MNIIGISGLAGSGKDTVAGFLLENEGFVSIAFADPIKRFAAEVWGFSYEQLWGASENRSMPDQRYKNGDEFLTPRKVLQYIGNDCARALDKDVWIRYAIDTAKTLLTRRGVGYSQTEGLEDYWSESYQNSENPLLEKICQKNQAVIITDCRYVNEFNAIKENGGKLIRVKRPGAGLIGEFGKHQSESEMSQLSDDSFDYVIDNIGTLEDLRNKVNTIADSLYTAQ